MHMLSMTRNNLLKYENYSENYYYTRYLLLSNPACFNSVMREPIVGVGYTSAQHVEDNTILEGSNHTSEKESG